MNPYMLDTNIVSYFIKGNHLPLFQRVKVAMQNQTAVISAITRAELRYSQALMPATDKRRTRIDLFLDEIPAIPWTPAVADTYGQLKCLLKENGTPIGEMDTQIAAHAATENLILVTHNTKRFECVKGLRLEDWTLT